MPDLSALTLPELRAWEAAIMAAIAAAETSGGGASLYADEDGVSVVLFFPFEPEE
jgi:hypothetical protein